MYWVTATFFSSAFILSRELKKSLTGGWVNKYADVAADGTYSSPIENPNRRFFTMLGTLIRGRVTGSIPST